MTRLTLAGGAPAPSIDPIRLPQPVPDSVPTLNYAQPRRFARLRRLMGPGSAAFFMLILITAAVGAWGVWKWRLKADEKAFNERTYAGPYTGWITFSKPPNAASLRHLNRLPGTWNICFDWSGPEDPAAPLILRSRRWTGVRRLWLWPGVNADAWLKELARPDTGFKSLDYLELNGSQVTAAGLKELARPDTGLTALTTLDLSRSQVTDAGLMELARPDSGLAALTVLYLYDTQVTDAGVKELTRPDSGLKALTTLSLWKTKVTDAGMKELARPDSGLRALTSLGVDNTRFTDAGLTELARPDTGLKGLTALSLWGTQVTDAGLKELARPDGGLKALTELNVISTGVTKAGIAELKKARPGLTFDER